MSHLIHPHIGLNAHGEFMVDLTRAVAMNNQAHALARSGDLRGAERLHLQALEIKERSRDMGPRHISTGISLNALGELYMTMGRDEEAEKCLNRALVIRRAEGPEIDVATTRENLAKVYERRGNLERAKQFRLEGGATSICCSNYECPTQLFPLDKLQQCSKCKVAYYCSRDCQMTDWKERHKLYCKSDVL